MLRGKANGTSLGASRLMRRGRRRRLRLRDAMCKYVIVDNGADEIYYLHLEHQTRLVGSGCAYAEDEMIIV